MILDAGCLYSSLFWLRELKVKSNVDSSPVIQNSNGNSTDPIGNHLQIVVISLLCWMNKRSPKTTKLSYLSTGGKIEVSKKHWCFKFPAAKGLFLVGKRSIFAERAVLFWTLFVAEMGTVDKNGWNKRHFLVPICLRKSQQYDASIEGNLNQRPLPNFKFLVTTRIFAFLGLGIPT